MFTVPTLFYSPFCDYCQEVLETIAPVFAGRLVVRTPGASERKMITAVPALFLPEGELDNDKPLLLIGSQLPSWVRRLKEVSNDATATTTVD